MLNFDPEDEDAVKERDARWFCCWSATPTSGSVSTWISRVMSDSLKCRCGGLRAAFAGSTACWETAHDCAACAAPAQGRSGRNRASAERDQYSGVLNRCVRASGAWRGSYAQRAARRCPPPLQRRCQAAKARKLMRGRAHPTCHKRQIRLRHQSRHPSRSRHPTRRRQHSRRRQSGTQGSLQPSGQDRSNSRTQRLHRPAGRRAGAARGGEKRTQESLPRRQPELSLRECGNGRPVGCNEVGGVPG